MFAGVGGLSCLISIAFDSALLIHVAQVVWALEACHFVLRVFDASSLAIVLCH